MIQEFNLKKYFLLLGILTIIHISLCAQQFLNIDFEKLSVEGIARPWGWSINSIPGTVISLDSIVRKTGKYSLCINQSNQLINVDYQFISYSIEPFELIHNQVEFCAWVRSTGEFDYLGIEISYSGAGDVPKPTKLDSVQVRALDTVNWQFLSVSAEIPSDARMVNVSLQGSGIGKAWIDGVALKINGKEKEWVETAKPVTPDELLWLDKWSYPLYSVDARLSPDENPETQEDLSHFHEITKGARIIALGESTHGTSEFFRLKHRILEYAVNNMGVRIFAIEDNQLVVERVNQFVLGGEGTSRSCMYGMFSVWQNEEVHSMIRWVREYNDRNPGDKVSFVGFDIQNLSFAMDSLYAYTKRKSPELHNKVVLRLDEIRKKGSSYWSESDSTRLAWYQNAFEVFDEMQSLKPLWLNGSMSDRDSLEIQWGIQYANIVKQYAENAYKGHTSLYRDKAMAENITWILDRHGPQSKMIIWAHDYHISLGVHPDSSLNIYEGKSMGNHLRKKYGDEYKSFGISTYSGSYWAQISYTDFRQLICPLYPAPRGSLDEALHRIALKRNVPGLLLDLSYARNQEWFIRPIPTRFANHVNIEYGYWTRYSIPYQFDGIFFWDRTSAARSYAR